MAEEKKEEPKKDTGKSVNKMLLALIGFAVVNIAVVGAGAYMVFAATIGWHAPEITETQLANQKEKENQKGSVGTGELLYTMDKFTANLAGDPLKDPQRKIQIEVNLDMLNKEGFEEIISSDRRAKARDKILQVLGNKTFGEVETIQGKLFLKDQIAQEINSLLDKGVVRDVYFTSFVVQ
jgi:flagellar FliL protein